jgi:hypothetical protein
MGEVASALMRSIAEETENCTFNMHANEGKEEKERETGIFQ